MALRHPLLVLLLRERAVVVVGEGTWLLELAQVELVVEGITVSLVQQIPVVAVEVVIVVLAVQAVQVSSFSVTSLQTHPQQVSLLLAEL
jgi:hypothetical protein